jgi:hypothetical protein
VVASVAAAKATFSVSPNAVLFDAARYMAASADSFEVEGQEVRVREGNRVRVETTVFDVAAHNVFLQFGHWLYPQRGEFAVGGEEGIFFQNKVMVPLPARFLLDSDGVTPHLGLTANVIASAASFTMVAYTVTFGTRLLRKALLITEPPSFDTLFQSLTLTGELVSDPVGTEQLFKPGW